MSTKPIERVEPCGVRLEYAKYFDHKKYTPFQLYTTYTKPGLVNIFFNEDQRCFHNWGFEVGSGQKRGRIREAMDHQINAPVMEIIGPHDGSVYMMCPPDPKLTMNVDMPYVTILMRDMHGYSSVEFTVLDSLGFSRKISSKNFKSQCTIGELNLDIPMRISPTWNYACVNLDDTLYNAFGTKLVYVQRIKINAYARIRRVYFSEEIFPYKSLPQEFRIKLALTPEEKLEIQMYDEFFTNEAAYFAAQEQRVPWALPKLLLGKSEIQPLGDTNYPMNMSELIRKKADIVEVPAVENEPEKYDDIKVPKHQMDSNAAVLREMLQKSIPPSKILLPTLSLIYPDKHAQNSADMIQTNKIAEYLKRRGRGERETGFFGKSCKVGNEDDESFSKLKRCFELDEKYNVEIGGEDDLDDPRPPDTDWEKINHPHHDHHRKSHHHRQSHHHYHYNVCKHNAKMLAKYLKQREVLGSYDLFSATVKNPKFFMYGQGSDADDVSDEDVLSSTDSEVIPDLLDAAADKKGLASHHSHFSPSAGPTTRPSRMTMVRRSTVSKGNLQNPSEEDGDDVGVESVESWILSWSFAGASWVETREINQKLLNDAWIFYFNENKRKSMLESSMTTHQNAKTKELYRIQQQQKKLPTGYRAAVPMLPKLKFLKEGLEGTAGHFDAIFDNPTMPIDYY